MCSAILFVYNLGTINETPLALQLVCIFFLLVYFLIFVTFLNNIANIYINFGIFSFLYICITFN